MKIVKLSMLAAVMLTAGMTTVKAQTADEIIQKHITAIGGTENWNKIKSMKKIGSMSIQGMDVSMIYTVANFKGIRTDISAMGMNGYVIATPTEGWMYLPFQGMDKVTPIPAEQIKTKTYQEQLNVKANQLIDKSNISKAEYLGKDTINNVACLKLKITDKEGNEQTDYFDASTYYMIRTEAKVKGGGKDKDEEQDVTANFSDFQKQPEGVVIAMTVSAPMGGGDINFKSIEINKSIDENIFKPSATDKK
jgi:hypothetical protein